jgi:hypothetical protein
MSMFFAATIIKEHFGHAMMTTDQIINSVIAAATSGAAVFALLTARAAKTQGKAALVQIDLLRPRPVVVIEGGWNLEAEIEAPDAFLVRNIGSSPAFDIQITEIKGPIRQPYGYREHLATDRIFVIAEKSDALAEHHRLAPGSQIDQRAAATFIKAASTSFDASMDEPDSLRPVLEFKVSYKALDGRQFETPCRILFWLGLNARADIAPVSSWLGQKSISAST